MKKLGRPTVLPTEVSAALRTYVLEHPLAILEDMQGFLETEWGKKCSRATISRQLWDLGFERGMIRKGVRGMGNANVSETSELAVLGEVDLDRIRREVGRMNPGGDVVMVLGGGRTERGDAEQIMEVGGLLQRGLFIVGDNGSGVPVPGTLTCEDDEGGLDDEGPTRAEGFKGGVYNKRGKYAWLSVDRSAGVAKERRRLKYKPRRKPEPKEEQASEQDPNDVSAAASAAAEQIQEEFEDAVVRENSAGTSPSLRSVLRSAAIRQDGHDYSHMAALQRLGQYASDMPRLRSSAPSPSGGVWFGA